MNREPEMTVDPETGLIFCSCGKGFRQNTSFRLHYNNIHLRIRYRCRICLKDYTQLQQYNRHNKSDHLRGRLKTCKYCNKGFTLQSKLARHVQNHFKQKPKQGAKPAQCKHCRETFVNAKSIPRHMQICPVLNPHPSNKSFECGICHERFLSARLRTDHQKAKHQGKVFGCDLCHQTFKHRAYKYTHMCTYRKRIKTEAKDPLAS